MKRTLIVRGGHVLIVLAHMYQSFGKGVRKPNFATMSSLPLNYLSGVARSSSTSHAGLNVLPIPSSPPPSPTSRFFCASHKVS